MLRTLTLLVTFFLLQYSASAQETDYFISEPTGLPEVGWNKVHGMKNGNTLLFHFQPTKKIVVKVYDSSHKLKNTQSHLCRITDIQILKDVIFKGLFEINDEAVLFLEQTHLGKSQLVRLRFNGNDGALLEEKVLGEQQSMSKHFHFYVVKNNTENNYAVLTANMAPQFQEYKLSVTTYNKDHQVIKEVPLQVASKKYDDVQIVGFEAAPNGLCVSASLATLVANGTDPTTAGSLGTVALYDHLLSVYFLPKDSVTAITTQIDVSTNVFPFYTHFTYNPFAKSINLLLLSLKGVVYQFGLEYKPGALMADLFLKMDETSMDVTHSWITDKIVNAYLKKQTDTGRRYQGLPVKFYTNENGLSTMISESFDRYTVPQSSVRNSHNTYLGNIAITQIDDDGNEIWGTLLPNAQCFSSLNQYYDPHSLSKRWQSQRIFNDLPEQVYQRQFISFNPCLKNKDYYIIYNDYDKNFNNTIQHPGDTVYNFGSTNAVYYKMNRKKEISKHYLFGTPAEKEYTACFIEGAYYDEDRGTYAALVQQRKGKNVTLRMAWKRLD